MRKFLTKGASLDLTKGAPLEERSLPVIHQPPTPRAISTVAASPVTDTVTNADGTRLYLAHANGSVATYDAITGQLLSTVQVGTFLAGIDISPDGSYLLVVEDTQSPVPGTINGLIHRLELATGIVSDYSLTFGSIDGPFHDIAIFESGLAIATTRIRGSGQTTTYSLNTNTGVFSFLTSGSAAAPIVMPSANRRQIALAQGFNVSGPEQLYSLADNGSIRLDASFGPGSSGQSIAAFSGDGSLFARFSNFDGTVVRDNRQNLNVSLGSGAVGLAFDATGDYLYMLTVSGIQKYSTTSWTVVDTISTTGLAISFGNGYGSGEVLTVGPDSAYFLYNNGSALYRIDNPTAGTPVNGTTADDVMNGTAVADVLRGNDGNDSINGGDGNDILRGGNGDDILNGGAGRDAMYGGIGHDIYYVDNTLDIAVENDNLSGIDEVISSATFILGPNIEKLTLTGTGNINGTGNSLANILIGTTGNNVLNGMAGADQMTGGLGNDTYWIDNSSDQAIELANQGTDTVITTLATYTLGSDLENLTFGGIGTFAGTGNDLSNIIIGGTGVDTLLGGIGNDILRGGNGRDLLDGGAGTDTASYGGSIGAASVDLAITAAQFTGATGTDTLVSIENLIGTSFADNLKGDDSANQIDGSGGADTLIGRAGNDRLILGFGASGASIDGGADIDTLVIGASTASLAGLVGIEALELNGGANLTLTGTQFSTGFASNTAVNGTGSITVNMDTGYNFLSQSFAFSGSGVTVTVNGTSGTDIIKSGTSVHIINAGDGVDQIRGGTAADTINGGAGNDKIIGFTGADILTGGTGSDQFRYLFAGDSGLGAAADRITDYTIGSDKINFLLIDADAATAGDQAFSFIGTGAFAATGMGQIRYTNSGADLLVQADINGDGFADMEIILQGLNGSTLTVGDFIL